MNENLTEKIKYIPGWLDRAEYNGLNNGLDIWGLEYEYGNSIPEKYIVAHSLGCHWALLNWHKNPQAKLILINPVFPDRQLGNWILRWLAFLFNEGIRHANPQRICMARYFFRGVLKSFDLLRNTKNIDVLLQKIPKDKIVVVRGKKDLFFCNKKSIEYFQKNDIDVIEIADMGHVFELNKAYATINSIIN